MFALGIAAGFGAALFSSLSYIASKSFINRYKSPYRLMMLAHIIMMVLAMIVLACLYGRYELSFSLKSILLVLAAQSGFVTAQLALFLALHHVEASRYSSLLGLKILLLSLICFIFMKQPLTLLQWIAVILCTTAAVGMNYSGYRISWIAFIYLLFSLGGYICSDICQVAYQNGTKADSVIIQCFASISFSYLVLGILTLPALFFFKWKPREILWAIPYSSFWFLSVLVLFFCFYEIGLVYGSVLQATRGLISVILGALLVRFGFGKGHEDESTTKRDWIRRGVMAILMIIAVGLYTYGKTH